MIGSSICFFFMSMVQGTISEAEIHRLWFGIYCCPVLLCLLGLCWHVYLRSPSLSPRRFFYLQLFTAVQVLEPYLFIYMLGKVPLGFPVWYSLTYLLVGSLLLWNLLRWTRKPPKVTSG